jgi:dTMP kinase
MVKQSGGQRGPRAQKAIEAEGEAERGKLIVFEGPDGSGKRTQSKLLLKYLRKTGIKTKYIEFPQYDTPFGSLVAKYLRGEFGDLESIPPEIPAILFALDRYQFLTELESSLARGTYVIANRYSESNLGYQASKVSDEAFGDFIKWLDCLEERLPKADLVFYLHLPITQAQELIANRSDKKYLKGQSKDIHEEDVEYQEKVARTYLKIAKIRRKRWIVIECSKAGKTKSRAEVHEDIIEQIEQR